MSDEYISRENITERLERVIEHGVPNTMGTHSITAEVTLEVIRDIPAADVVEVVHASWMAENSRPKSGIFYCSCCHRTCYDPQPTRAKGWTKRCRYHYCPNCGAVMDGGQDDV